MGWFKDFFFGDMDEEIDTYENTPTKKVEKKVTYAPEVEPKSKVTAIKTKERNTRTVRPTPKSVVPKQKHLQPVKRQVKTQMVYQYPKGEFRFPLIPDKPVSQPIQTQKQTQPTRTMHQTSEKPVVKEETRKRPFAATDVPSPVYAFNKRPSKFEFAVSETDEIAEIQEDLTIPPVDLPELAEAETIAFDTEIEKQIEDTYQEEVGIEEVVEEPVLASNEATPVEPAPKRVTLIQEETTQVPRQKKQVEASRQEQMLKSRIPFNVMMVKKDKQALQKEPAAEIVQEKEVITENIQPVAITEERQVAPEYPSNYQFPSFGLLHPPVSKREDDSWLQMQQEMLDETLENFNVHASVVNRTQGPAVTRFEVQPEKGGQSK